MGTNASSKNQQIEFDVFPKEKRQKNSYPFDTQNDTTEESTAISVIFSNQSVFVIIICAVLLLIASFSLGVEKGKLITKSDQKAIEIAQVSHGAQESRAPEIKAEVRNSKSTEIRKSAKPEKILTDKAITSKGLQENKKIFTKAGYTIQVASLKTDSAAKELSESLIKRGVPSFTKTSGEYIIVFAGNFKTRKAAQLQHRELKKSFNDCFIRKI